MADVTARQVADYTIAFLAEHGDPVTNLKLQKLLYYAQAWYLALYDIPLFDDRIEAWVHGPAVPPVYADFKGFGWQPIPPPINGCTLPDRPEAHVVEVIEVYGGFSAYELERLTHQEYPWINARRGVAPDEQSHNIISLEDMKNCYRARLNVENQAR
jgi:uncharacterized phage-associated protein